MSGRIARVLLLWLLCASAWAQGGALVLGAEQRHNLGPYVNVFEDRTGALRLQDILQPAQQARFHAVTGSGLSANFGMTRGAIWVRVEVRSPK